MLILRVTSILGGQKENKEMMCIIPSFSFHVLTVFDGLSLYFILFCCFFFPFSFNRNAISFFFFFFFTLPSCSFLSFFSNEEPEQVLVLGTLLFFYFLFSLVQTFIFSFSFLVIFRFLTFHYISFGPCPFVPFLIDLQILYVRLLIWRIKFSFGFDKLDRRNSIKLKSLKNNKNILLLI